MALLQDKHQDVPAKTATVAMWFFLASLAMLFFAGMLAYILMRFRGLATQPENAAQIVRTHMPFVFVISTVVVLAASWTVQMAVRVIRRERVAELKMWIWATFGLALFFCVLQVPGLYQVFEQHVPRTQTGANLSRLLFCLIILHALHVVGGIVYMAVVSVRAARGVYDHEHYIGVKHAAMYWHFLDVVWLIMYGTMLAVG